MPLWAEAPTAARLMIKIRPSRDRIMRTLYASSHLVFSRRPAHSTLILRHIARPARAAKRRRSPITASLWEGCRDSSSGRHLILWRASLLQPGPIWTVARFPGLGSGKGYTGQTVVAMGGYWRGYPELAARRHAAKHAGTIQAQSGFVAEFWQA